MAYTITDSSTSQPVAAKQTTKILTYTFASPPSIQGLVEMARDALLQFEGLSTECRVSKDPEGNQQITVQAIAPPEMP